MTHHLNWKTISMMAKKAQEKKFSGFGQLKGTPPLDAVVEKNVLFDVLIHSIQK